ncbi:hypothetical protein GCM10009678_51220 [Actinomadura kijaniata]|uniref:Uncharacterized protein n=1 Tax=Actinomadura namibiensis TaxID=182080 RepID=A0A7W3QK39_ACTNM|nr:hypothetical protein [Actinomadura namibiensis]MBA8950099.1 hypothetical protein [Actinomadura namibiensis]
MTIPGDLKRSLRRLREVRARRPVGEESPAFAGWRDEMADALDELSRTLLLGDDRARAAAEAAAARVEAGGIRARLG